MQRQTIVNVNKHWHQRLATQISSKSGINSCSFVGKTCRAPHVIHGNGKCPLNVCHQWSKRGQVKEIMMAQTDTKSYTLYDTCTAWWLHFMTNHDSDRKTFEYGSVWLLLDFKRTMFQLHLYHGKNKIQFEEMVIMMSALD